MSPRERARRWIDGELDAREEQELHADAARDPELAKELEDARIVARALGHLDTPEVPSDLVNASVLRAVQHRAKVERETPAWRRWLAPRTVRVTPAAILFGALGALLVGLWIARDRVVVVERPVEQEPQVTVTDAAVRLVLPAEGARSVAVAGDFNDWQTDAVFLEDPEGDGVFATTLRLPPGSYAYMFVIDGERWVTDPYAVNHRDDGFGNQNAVLRID